MIIHNWYDTSSRTHTLLVILPAALLFSQWILFRNEFARRRNPFRHVCRRERDSDDKQLNLRRTAGAKRRLDAFDGFVFFIFLPSRKRVSKHACRWLRQKLAKTRKTTRTVIIIIVVVTEKFYNNYRARRKRR